MRLLTRDLEGVFRDCKMVAVAQNSGSTSHDMIMLKNRFHKHDIHVRLFPNQVNKRNNQEALTRLQLKSFASSSWSMID